MFVPLIAQAAHRLGFFRAAAEVRELQVGQFVTENDLFRTVPKVGIHKITTLSCEGEKQDLLFIDGERQGAFVTHGTPHIQKQKELAEKHGGAGKFCPIGQEVHLQAGATILFPLYQKGGAQPIYLFHPTASVTPPTKENKGVIRKLMDDYLFLLANPNSGVEVMINPPPRGAVRGLTPTTFTVKKILGTQPK